MAYIAVARGSPWVVPSRESSVSPPTVSVGVDEQFS